MFFASNNTIAKPDKSWLLHSDASPSEINRPLIRLAPRPCPRGAWPIGTSRGTGSALCAPTAKCSWRVSTSPPGTTAPTASSALAAYTPRSARPAPNQSQVRPRPFANMRLFFPPLLTKPFSSPLSPRFRRRKVHLIRGSPVAPALLHLLPVLRLTGGCRLLPRRRQDPVPRMQQ